MRKLIDFLIKNNIQFEENVSLKKRTWIKTGGSVSVWIEPNTIESLILLAKFLFESKIKYETVGHTSNIYYLDATNPQVIVSTKNLISYRITDSCVNCDCGVHVSTLSRALVNKGIVGFSGLINLPGTVGAATVNNSSCFGSEFSSLIKDVSLFDKSTGTIKTICAENLMYGHRSSALKSKLIDAVVISVSLKLIKGCVDEEVRKAKEATETRKYTQEPPAYTLGSVFANLNERKNLGYRFFRKCYMILAKLHFVKKPSRTHLLLKYYGYEYLKPYVSDKNVNTFIWKPEIENKELFFSEYCNFMRKAFVDPRLEIEVR